MVFWNDYVDKHFGWYIITQHIGSGVEAEVFTCVNLATQRAFALKLSVEDDAAWEGPNVQLPPRNAQSTRRSIEGTIGAKRSVYGRDPSTHVAEMYQVIDSQYLAPLTNTEKLKGAASIFEILAIPKWLITVNPLWEDLSLLLRADIEKLSRGNSAATTDFRERWLPILRGSRLGKNLLDTNLSQTTGASLEVLKELVHGPPADSLDIGPIFEETLVYRLHTAWVTEHYSMHTILRTLECPFMRENITVRDLQCLVNLLRIALFSRNTVIGVPLFPDADVAFFNRIGHVLERPPLTPADSPSDFEEVGPVADAVLDEVQTVLQEFIPREPQRFISLRYS